MCGDGEVGGRLLAKSRAKETAVAGRAQDATEVLKASLAEAGQGKMLQGSPGRAWGGWPWLAMVEIFGLYHRIMRNYLSTLSREMRSGLHFLRVTLMATRIRLERSQTDVGELCKVHTFRAVKDIYD